MIKVWTVSQFLQALPMKEKVEDREESLQGKLLHGQRRKSTTLMPLVGTSCGVFRRLDPHRDLRQLFDEHACNCCERSELKENHLGHIGT